MHLPASLFSKNQTSLWQWSRRILIGATLTVILLLSLFVLAVLLQLRSNVDSDLEEKTQNLSNSLELLFDGQIDAIDIALVSAANEISHQTRTGRPNVAEVNRHLGLLKSKLSLTDVIRATNERGDIVYGINDSYPLTNVSNRLYFPRLRDEPESGLIISPPLYGVTDKEWIWVFARRINKPDGSFGGVVIARTNISKIQAMFKQVNLNASGFIALRHSDHSLIARYQSGADNVIPIGDKRMSSEMRSMLETHPHEGTFFIDAASNFDHINRMLSYRVNPKYGFMVLVGMDRDVVLENWRNQVWLACGLLVALAATALRIAFLISAAWKRNHEAEASQKVIEAQVRQIAFYDPLTQLPNRRLLGDRLNQSMMTGRRNGSFSALMFIDLDNFKPLNDAQGHEVGDRLLVEVATRLRSCVREVDTVVRFGGDEFVVLLGDLSADKTDSTEQARLVAEKIRTAIARPFELLVQREGEFARVLRHECSASIGVMLFANQEYGATEIIRMADSAMYRAKDAGRNAIRFVGDN